MKLAKLLIKDEVNVKIEGLDLTDRKYLVNLFKYDIPGARYTPAVRLGRWDGKISFAQLNGSTYINLLPSALAYLDKQGYRVELEDLRNYQTKFEFTQVVEDSYSHLAWSETHPAAGQPIMLRDYQVNVINQFLANPQCLQEVPTGSGKTLVTAVLSHRCEPHGRTIIIVPNKSLVTQTESDYRNMGLDVGVYFGDRKEFGRTHTICTWQSLNILMKGSREHKVDITIGEFIQDVVCVIVDECHTVKADALKTLLTGVMSHIPIRWGLTGTIPREDYEFASLRCSIGEVIGKLSASELQEQGVLANCHVNILQLVDHAEYNNYQTELKYLLETGDRLIYLAGLIENIRKSGNTLVLVDRIAPGKALVGMVKDAVFVSGSTKTIDRKEQYDDIAIMNDKVIIATYGIAAVGINIPRIFNLVLIEPGKSFVRVIQSIGRGIRKADDKDFVNIYDVTSTCKFARRHLSKRIQYYKEAGYPYEKEKLEWK